MINELKFYQYMYIVFKVNSVVWLPFGGYNACMVPLFTNGNQIDNFFFHLNLVCCNTYLQELNLDLVQFPRPVLIQEVRIIPLQTKVQADVPGGVRLG